MSISLSTLFTSVNKVVDKKVKRALWLDFGPNAGRGDESRPDLLLGIWFAPGRWADLTADQNVERCDLHWANRVDMSRERMANVRT